MVARYGTPSGAIVKKLCDRAFTLFSQDAYENLAKTSVSYLYNLRDSKAYQKQRRTFKKTQVRQASIGERRKPVANGEPGYTRIDTIHQGDQDGLKGAYHFNTVDEVTQYEVVLSTSRINEQQLIAILKEVLKTFPFQLKVFMLIMVRNTLTVNSQNYSTNSILN